MGQEGKVSGDVELLEEGIRIIGRWKGDVHLNGSASAVLALSCMFERAWF
jgi:hypothetical protein